MAKQQFVPNKPVQQRQVTVQQQVFSGPIPDPETLSRYDAISVGFADRLIQMAEKEQSSRLENQKQLIDMEQFNQKREHLNIRRAQIYALVSVLGVVGLCVYCLYLNQPETAKVIAISVLVGLAAVFLGYKLKNRNQNNSRH
jgi:uncharacterized membrane protein